VSLSVSLSHVGGAKWQECVRSNHGCVCVCVCSVTKNFSWWYNVQSPVSSHRMALRPRGNDASLLTSFTPHALPSSPPPRHPFFLHSAQNSLTCTKRSKGVVTAPDTTSVKAARRRPRGRKKRKAELYLDNRRREEASFCRSRRSLSPSRTAFANDCK